MSSDTCISVKNVSKVFKIYEQPSDRLKQFVNKNKSYYKEFWGLRDVSFEIPKGSIVGIIGRNGAGKSTLLQILAGTMTPSSGEVKLSGAVSALLELGSGFNPEFTGIENIYMNATILGLGKAEIEEKMDSIITFADIGEFINRPVKTYSSGMFVRLAFAVSTCMEPEILIVDEALSVGDVAFQKKCFDRIKSLINKGTSVLLVSHDMSTIRMLCDTVIYLENGSVSTIGDPKTVVDEYMRKMLGKDDHLAEKDNINSVDHTIESGRVEWRSIAWEKTPSALKYEYSESDIDKKVNGSLKAIIEKCLVLDKQYNPVNQVLSKETYIVRCYIRILKNINYFNVGILLRDKYGQDVFGQSMDNLNLNIETQFSAGDIILCDIEIALNIKHGTYFITIGLQDGEFNEIFFYGTDILTLEIEAVKNSIFGLVDIPCAFQIREVYTNHSIG